MRLNSTLRIHKLGKVYMIVDNCADNSNLATVYTLNSTAGWLWMQVADRDFTVDSLADMLCDAYEVDRDTALADVAAIVEKWIELGLVAR